MGFQDYLQHPNPHTEWEMRLALCISLSKILVDIKLHFFHCLPLPHTKHSASSVLNCLRLIVRVLLFSIVSLILKFCTKISPDTLFPLVYAMPLVFKLPPKILPGCLKKIKNSPAMDHVLFFTSHSSLNLFR